jgi:hypothetical protein
MTLSLSFLEAGNTVNNALKQGRADGKINRGITM